LPASLDFFFNFEIQVVKPVVNNRLTDTVTFPGGFTATVNAPQASLGWAVSPRFEVGSVLPEDQGLFALSYRFLITSGSSTVIGPDGGSAGLHSGLDFNVVDFDYGTPTVHFAPRWDYNWRLGFRLGQAFFDSTLSDPAVNLKTSDWFLGGGIHGRFDVNREIGLIPGLAVFGRVEGAVMFGQIHQRFTETVFIADGTSTTAMDFLQKVQTVPVLELQAGLRYTPPSWQRFHLAAGYQFEEWYQVGRVSGTSSRGDFYTNGVFLRAGFDY
jgi:hypothetical protein